MTTFRDFVRDAIQREKDDPSDGGFPVNMNVLRQIGHENGLTDDEIEEAIANIPQKTTAPEIMALIRSKAKGK